MGDRTMGDRAMGDRDCRALGVRHGVHTSAELSGERLDDDRAQSRRCPGRIQMGLRCPNAIVGNRKSPTRIGHLIGNDKLASGAVADKGVLERIDDELRDEETDTARIGG
jgi:hypothetical protein